MHPAPVLLGLCAIVLLLASSGCYYDVESELYPGTSCDTSVTTYADVVLPIIQSNCAIPGCHVPGGTGTGDFTTYAGLRTQVVSQRLVPSVQQASGALPMPPTGKLSDCDIAKIVRWVDNGAQNN
ncbi:MAG: hypothetical protein JST66_01535 [Bacteroidetes bacterium]|nr:hypothetical protein [Bacteroidota bacterium]